MQGKGTEVSPGDMITSYAPGRLAIVLILAVVDGESKEGPEDRVLVLHSKGHIEWFSMNTILIALTDSGTNLVKRK